MTTTPKVTGRHRAKIGTHQTASDETLARISALNAHVLGPGSLAVSEWEAAGLRQPDLDSIRRYRLERLRMMLRRYDYAGIVLYDPINIRYAVDSTNMQVWITHNANRYVFVATDGPVILFDYHGAEHLSAHLDLIDELRSATAWYYLIAGDRFEEQANKWAAEIADLVHRYGGGNTRLALDRCNPEGSDALSQAGISVQNGEEVMELTRVIKSDEEIVAMCCAITACENAMQVMQDNLVPGMTEQRLWGYLHAENIARGGEWIETRLLNSGPRTNPWLQECSSREIQAGDLVAFDTDLVGPYGICVDVSRTWLCGDVSPTAAQTDLHQRAVEQIERNTELLRVGLSFKEMTELAFQNNPAIFNRYSILYHGVGLVDEYPTIYFPEDWDAVGYDGVLEENMVICVESFVGRKDGGEGVKLEEQVLISTEGPVTLSSYPLGLTKP
ncbi:MAG: Xaa-Pro peptidase family protein [Chloroflexota bacterium]